MRFDPRRIFVHAVLKRMVRPGTRIATVEEYVRLKTENPDSPAPPNGKTAQGLDVTETVVDDTVVYRVTPPHASGRAVVYLHGGSFIGEIISSQWDFVMELARASGATALVPIYTVAPHATAERTVPQMTAVLRSLIAEHGAENVSVMGDSAGAGIAMTAVQALRDSGDPLPARLVLIAPMLDATLSDPGQADIAPHDLLARRDYLLDASRQYAGDLPLDHPLVSSLHGSVEGLPPMHVFTGAHDIVATDSRRLVERVRAVGGEIEYTEPARMQHGYPILPLLREARDAKREIARLIG